MFILSDSRRINFNLRFNGSVNTIEYDMDYKLKQDVDIYIFYFYNKIKNYYL